MTPVASWSPADFHAAFDRCRSLWQQSAPQLTISGWADMLDRQDSGLGGADAGAVRSSEPASAAPSPEVAGGLALNRYAPGGATFDEDARRRAQEGA